jgi:hypothetical protein
MVAALGTALLDAGRTPSELGIPVNSALPVDQISIA